MTEREPIWEDRGAMPDFEKDYWDEYDWERFMAEQDRKVEELMRLDKIFLDSGMRPDDRDLELMGFEPCDKNCKECGERSSCWEFQEELARESREATGTPEPEPEDLRDDFHDIPVYKACFEFTCEAMDWFKEIPEEFWDEQPAMRMFAENCGVPGAKIAGGNAMSRGPDSIGGNIANCKRAHAAMGRCIEALDVLMTIPETAEKAAHFKPIAEECHREIWVRVEEVRAEARRLWGTSNH